MTTILKSVACTKELKRRYFPNDDQWRIETGSVLDKVYLRGLGKFDVVCSWGVLHHTGKMWVALENITENVTEERKIFLALYNDQGCVSKLWWIVKKTYVSLPKYFRWLVIIPCYIRLWGATTFKDLIFLKPFKAWRTYKQNRGMSPHRDMIDWVGGFPFEVSKPEEIFNFYKLKRYRLVMLITCSGGHGCNQYVFQKD